MSYISYNLVIILPIRINYIGNYYNVVGKPAINKTLITGLYLDPSIGLVDLFCFFRNNRNKYNMYINNLLFGTIKLEKYASKSIYFKVNKCWTL